MGLLGVGVGAVSGTADKVVHMPDEILTKEITHFVASYSPWEYWTVICIGAILVALAIWLFLMACKKQQEDTPLPLAE